MGTVLLKRDQYSLPYGLGMEFHGHPSGQNFHKLKMLVTNSSIMDVKQLVLFAVNV